MEINFGIVQFIDCEVPGVGEGFQGECGYRIGGLTEPWTLLHSQVGLAPETEKGGR